MPPSPPGNVVRCFCISSYREDLCFKGDGLRLKGRQLFGGKSDPPWKKNPAGTHECEWAANHFRSNKRDSSRGNELHNCTIKRQLFLYHGLKTLNFHLQFGGQVFIIRHGAIQHLPVAMMHRIIVFIAHVLLIAGTL